MRFARLLTAASFLAGCVPVALHQASPFSWRLDHQAVTACHFAPDGSAPAVKGEHLAERGIGGTGPISSPGTTAPTPTPSTNPTAPSGGGIGGTGVSGIVTGFGSICLDGLEVGLATGLHVTADGSPTDAMRLRAGQRVALIASWESGQAVTAAIGIRHEVVGPIEAIQASQVIVAGQTVKLALGFWRAVPLQVGNWVAVSGLPMQNGVILATRMDAAEIGPVLIRGILQHGSSGTRIGSLPLMGKIPMDSGTRVSISGHERAGTLVVDRAVPDLLETDPPAFFGPEARHFIIQSFIHRGGSADISVSGVSAAPAMGPLGPVGLPNAAAPPDFGPPAGPGLSVSGLNAAPAMGPLGPVGLPNAAAPPGFGPPPGPGALGDRRGVPGGNESSDNRGGHGVHSRTR
jgi:Domain of unknown function (DUF5666)